MKILNARADFTGGVNPGRYAFIIELSRNGAVVTIDSLVNQAVHFPRVVLKGEEVFEQKDNVSKLVKKLIKQKPEVIVEIYTPGTIRPIGIGSLKNIIYNVEVGLKNNGVSHDKRIVPEVLRWFVEIGANFIFYIKEADDIDEANLLIQEHAIKKSSVFLSPYPNSKEKQMKILLLIINAIKIRGYNFFVNFYDLYWKDVIGGNK